MIFKTFFVFLFCVLIAYRKERVKSRQQSLDTLSPICRSLFDVSSPPAKRFNGSAEKTPSNTLKKLLTPHSMRYNTPDTSQVVRKPVEDYNVVEASPTLTLMHSINESSTVLDEKFTVKSILKEINLEKYTDLFDREEIDLFVFSTLTLDDMNTLEIDNSDRPILMKAIENYSEIFGNV